MKVTLTLTFWKDQSVLATVLQTIAAVSLLVALVFCCATIGVFADKFNHFKDMEKKAGFTGDLCFLYMDYSYVDGNLKFGDDSYCEFVIYGQSVVLVTLALLVILLMLTIFIRSDIDFGIEVMIFLGFVVISFLLCVTASLVLSIGFSKTCETIEDASNGAVRCSSDYFTGQREIYDAVAQSTAFSWIETVYIGILLVVSSVYLYMRISKRKICHQTAAIL